MQIETIGMAWYRAENFDRLRAMFEDGHKLHGTYKEWLLAAEKNRKVLESQGVRVVCVDIDPDRFSEWCKTNGKKLNAAARIEYSTRMADKIAAGGQSGDSVHHDTSDKEE
ncbi:MAG: hypothetical protein HY881_20665 [Deltaproteobacteria bacterium]|nr:hypothetical protein [Deltaproteobacteria bacterium]